MKIGLLRETLENETRVALIPTMVSEISKIGASVLVEKDAGLKATFSNEAYEKAGAEIVSAAKKIYKEADLVLKIQPPSINGSSEVKMLREGSSLIGLLSPLTNLDLVEKMLQKNITAFSLEFVPRISSAQSMDVLSSMRTVAGYKAVLLATQYFGKFFPLLMTAAGTIPPAGVFILGAGVAGLQAIATAKRLGAKVEAFDLRPSVKEQIESLWARFVEMELPEDVETKEGYAKEISADFI